MRLLSLMAVIVCFCVLPNDGAWGYCGASPSPDGCSYVKDKSEQIPVYGGVGWVSSCGSAGAECTMLQQLSPSYPRSVQGGLWCSPYGPYQASYVDYSECLDRGFTDCDADCSPLNPNASDAFLCGERFVRAAYAASGCTCKGFPTEAEVFAAPGSLACRSPSGCGAPIFNSGVYGSALLRMSNYISLSEYKSGGFLSKYNEFQWEVHNGFCEELCRKKFPDWVSFPYWHRLELCCSSETPIPALVSGDPSGAPTLIGSLRSGGIAKLDYWVVGDTSHIIEIYFQWKRCTTMGNQPTSNCLGIDGATKDSYTITPTDVQWGAISVEVRLLDSNCNLSGYSEVFHTLDAAPPPTASGVVLVSGTLGIGQTLIVSYTYTDPKGEAEGASTFQWYTASDSACTAEKSAITDATSKTYTLTSGEAGKYVCFGVIPVTSSGVTGLESIATTRTVIGSGSSSSGVTGLESIATTRTVIGSGSSSCTTPVAGDVNNDCKVDLKDTVLALRIVAGISVTDTINLNADVNGDKKIGMEEVIYILQKVSGLR